jgi:hypothetical protein
MNTDIDEVAGFRSTGASHRSNSKENQSMYQSKRDNEGQLAPTLFQVKMNKT